MRFLPAFVAIGWCTASCKFREEIKKLASGHISHSAASRLAKMAEKAIFLKILGETAANRAV
jgi:hypothetical protein